MTFARVPRVTLARMSVPGAQHHRAEAARADLDTGANEGSILHPCPPRLLSLQTIDDPDAEAPHIALLQGHGGLRRV